MDTRSRARTCGSLSLVYRVQTSLRLHPMRASVIAAVAAAAGAAAAPCKTPLLTPTACCAATAPAAFEAAFKTTAGDFTLHVERAWAPLGVDRFYNMLTCGYLGNGTDGGYVRGGREGGVAAGARRERLARVQAPPPRMRARGASAAPQPLCPLLARRRLATPPAFSAWCQVSSCSLAFPVCRRSLALGSHWKLRTTRLF